MKLGELPFLHYLAPDGSGVGKHVVSPFECPADDSKSKSLMAPVQLNGRMFGAYRFDYVVTLLGGKFYELSGERVRFSGVAIPNIQGHQEHLALTFVSGGEEPWPYFDFEPRLKVLQHEREIILPKLRRVSRRDVWSYSGKLSHDDFRWPFVKLSPSPPGILDVLLKYCGIVVLGCDPLLRYQGAQNP